jgi:hypothetical protein
VEMHPCCDSPQANMVEEFKEEISLLLNLFWNKIGNKIVDFRVEELREDN